MQPKSWQSGITRTDPELAACWEGRKRRGRKRKKKNVLQVQPDPTAVARSVPTRKDLFEEDLRDRWDPCESRKAGLVKGRPCRLCFPGLDLVESLPPPQKKEEKEEPSGCAPRLPDCWWLSLLRETEIPAVSKHRGGSPTFTRVRLLTLLLLKNKNKNKKESRVR